MTIPDAIGHRCASNSRPTPAAFAGAVALMLAASGAPAGGALGPNGYPEPDCGPRPVAPERPEKFQTEAALNGFNDSVERYNSAMEAWIGCLQGYVDGAATDIKTIQARIRQALDLADSQ